MSTDRDRVISITLTATEWRAFIARQPKPVDWLRARILDEVGVSTIENPLSREASKHAHSSSSSSSSLIPATTNRI